MVLMNLFFIIEGMFDYWLNMIIVYLKKNEHHDLWDEFKRKYVKTFEEISEVPFYAKIQFVEKHGFPFIKTYLHRYNPYNEKNLDQKIKTLCEKIEFKIKPIC